MAHRKLSPILYVEGCGINGSGLRRAGFLDYDELILIGRWRPAVEAGGMRQPPKAGVTRDIEDRMLR